jgi:hypothetical protein
MDGGVVNGAQLQTESTLSLDAMRGRLLAIRVRARIDELEKLLATTESETMRARAIAQELAVAEAFMTGDNEHPADVVAHDMSEWLERTRYLG